MSKPKKPKRLSHAERNRILDDTHRMAYRLMERALYLSCEAETVGSGAHDDELRMLHRRFASLSRDWQEKYPESRVRTPDGVQFVQIESPGDVCGVPERGKGRSIPMREECTPAAPAAGSVDTPSSEIPTTPRVSDAEMQMLMTAIDSRPQAASSSDPRNAMIDLILDLRDARARIAALEAERDVLREKAERSAEFWKSIVYCDQPPLPTGDEPEVRKAILRRLHLLARLMTMPQAPDLVDRLDRVMGDIICHWVSGLRYDPSSGIYMTPEHIALATTPERQVAGDE